MTTSPSCARGAHTILVLSGCSCSPASAILSSRAARTSLACRSVAQVHHSVVGEALERDGRELAFQPRVERVVHEQVGEHGR